MPYLNFYLLQNHQQPNRKTVGKIISYFVRKNLIQGPDHAHGPNHVQGRVGRKITDQKKS
jgi:hypothetical protein